MEVASGGQCFVVGGRGDGVQFGGLEWNVDITAHDCSLAPSLPFTFNRSQAVKFGRCSPNDCNTGPVGSGSPSATHQWGISRQFGLWGGAQGALDHPPPSPPQKKHLVIRNPMALCPTSHVICVVTLQTPLRRERLCVEHRQRRRGRDANGQKQHLRAEGQLPHSRPVTIVVRGCWD